jgi:NAD-dependent SIR2 family protein deacetylase
MWREPYRLPHWPDVDTDDPPRSSPANGPLLDLLTSGRVLVLTGAGISTDSGIPDYRGPTGRQRHADPMTFERFTGSADERRRYWARSHLGWQRIGAARPNAGHRAVTSLQDAGLLTGVVTQNVDGLHTAAGTRDVVDLHGRLDAVICLQCKTRRPRVEMALRLDAVNPGFRQAMGDEVAVVRPDGDVVIPNDVVAGFTVVDCRRCGGMLKPDVVFFGESVPRDRFQRALGVLTASSALLVLGSSLTVGSGYRFVTAARHQGLPVAIVTRGVTRADHHATVKVDAGLAEVLPRLAAGAGAGQPAQ